MRIVAATVFFAASLVSVRAEPLPWPATDYQGEFAVPGAGGRTTTVSLHYQSEARRAAVTGAIRGFGVRGVVDVKDRKMRVVLDVMPDNVIEVGLPESKLKTEGEPTEEIREVEGEKCRVWRVEGSNVCFTEDGIWLQIQRGEVTIVLTKIERKPQSDSAFEIGEASGEKLPSLLSRIKFDGLNPFPF